MTKLLQVVLICSLSVSVLASTIPTKKEAAIIRLMQLDGTTEQSEQSMEMMVTLFKSMGLPADIIDIIREELNDEAFEKLYERIVPIYDKYLTSADIAAALKFYNSPAGKRFIQVRPQMTEECTIVCMEWSAELTGSLEAKLEKMMESGAFD